MSDLWLGLRQNSASGNFMRFFALLVVAYFGVGPALAQGVDPAEAALLRQAIADPAQAAPALAAADPVMRDTALWVQLRGGAGTLAEYQSFLADRADWPGLDNVRARAELKIGQDANPDDVVAFFDGRSPQTGEGTVALAKSHVALGQEKMAQQVLRDAWLALRLTDAGHQALIAAFPDELAPFHAARTDAMLWRWRTSDAQRMLPLLDPPQAALARARIGYIRKTADREARIAAVPEALRADPGLAYDRYNWLADRGDRTEAVKILLSRSTSRAALAEPVRWAGWRRSLARWEMREGRAEQAYQLASRHYLSEGSAFADLEWLSGYLALTYLGDPASALDHFSNAAAAVSTPISLARMHYWIGRSHAAIGQSAEAAIAYGAAATHQTAFYGLLASEKLGRPLSPILAGRQIVWQDTPVFEKDLTRAAFLLLAADQRGAAVTFFAGLADVLDEEELSQVGAYLDHIDEQYYTLLLGKRAARRGILVPENYYPLHDLAKMQLPVAPALALAVVRQESEFNIGVGSPVGALGLMQLMPATAKEVAGFLDLPYSRARLTSDWEYNATLGSKYLSILQEDFGQTPVMIAAGYNAGPSRPKQWMDQRGDPRLKEMDIVDWIEHIPFRETRNYVMRVTEAMPPYQARLTGETGPIAFTELLVGIKPLLRPRARPLPQAVGDTPRVRPVLRPARG